MATTVVKINGASEDNYENIFAQDNMVPSLIQREDGIIIIPYYRDHATQQLVVSHSNDHGATWTQVVIDKAITDAYIPFQGILSDNKVHNVQSDDHFNSFPCDTPTTLTLGWTPDTNFNVVDIIVDSSDDIHVLLIDLDAQKMYYTVYDTSAATWSTLEDTGVPTSPNAFKAKMCLDSNGKVHVIYHDANSFISINEFNLYYLTRETNGTWNTRVGVDESNAHNAYNPSIICDRSDNIHIVYKKKFIAAFVEDRSHVVYGKWNGSSFDLTALTSDTSGIIIKEFPFISFDESGNLYIFYTINTAGFPSAYNGELIKSLDNGSTFETAEAITSTTTDVYESVGLMKVNYTKPGNNIPIVGCAGVLLDQSNDDIYFFKTDDVNFKFPQNPASTFCSTDLDESGNCPYVQSGEVRKLVSEVSGLDHLEGETVQAQVDGVVPTDETNAYVVTGGKITLNSAAAVIHVGLPYVGLIRMLKLSEGGQQGSGQGKMRRIYDSVIRLQKSLGLKVGLDEDNLLPLFLDNEALPLFTGDQKKLPVAYWDDETEFVIKQDKPLPAFILAVLLESEVEERG